MYVLWSLLYCLIFCLVYTIKPFVILQIQTKCRPDICTQECKNTMRELRQHPCLKEDVWEYIKFFLMEEKHSGSGIDVEKLLVLYSVCDLQLGQEIGRDVIRRTTTMGMTPSQTTIRELTPTRTDTNHIHTCPKCPPTNLSICNNNASRNTISSMAAFIGVIISLVDLFVTVM